MSYNSSEVLLKPLIVVFGIGGAGNNAINNMIEAGLEGANFISANTDAQALSHSLAPVRLQLGSGITRGLGAGSMPGVGASAADESRDEIKRNLEGANMVFVTAGMGGGTGTGAAPVVAKIAKEMGILTIGVVTKPFDFEGAYRMQVAMKGIEELRQYVDTLIVIPNQNLFRLSNDRTTFLEAFRMSDEVLSGGVRSITDLMNMPGLINLDFADIRTIMSSMGTAVIGTGTSSDDDRAISAAKAAISNPLLSHSSIKGAQNVLINITGGMDMTLHEVDSAANHVRESVGNDEANIIFGSTFDPRLEGTIRISIIATGIDLASDEHGGTKSFQKDQTYNKQQRAPAAPRPYRPQQQKPVVSEVEEAHGVVEAKVEENVKPPVRKIKLGAFTAEIEQDRCNFEGSEYESPSFFRRKNTDS